MQSFKYSMPELIRNLSHPEPKTATLEIINRETVIMPIALLVKTAWLRLILCSSEQERQYQRTGL